MHREYDVQTQASAAEQQHALQDGRVVSITPGQIHIAASASDAARGAYTASYDLTQMVAPWRTGTSVTVLLGPTRLDLPTPSTIAADALIAALEHAAQHVSSMETAATDDEAASSAHHPPTRTLPLPRLAVTGVALVALLIAVLLVKPWSDDDASTDPDNNTVATTDGNGQPPTGAAIDTDGDADTIRAGYAEQMRNIASEVALSVTLAQQTASEQQLADWQTLAQLESARWPLFLAQVEGTTPPPDLAAAHDAYLAGLRLIADAAPAFDAGVQGDSAAASTAEQQLTTGLERLAAADDLLNAVQP